MRMRRLGILLFAISLVALSGCLFDSGVEWRGGPYQLIWIDDPQYVTVNYELSSSNSSQRIESCVFAVGWDGRYLVAKQHPKGDRGVTNFYYIDSSLDKASSNGEAALFGPFNETEFLKMKSEFKLPEFSKVLASLQ